MRSLIYEKDEVKIKGFKKILEGKKYKLCSNKEDMINILTLDLNTFDNIYIGAIDETEEEIVCEFINIIKGFGDYKGKIVTHTMNKQVADSLFKLDARIQHIPFSFLIPKLINN